jgi:uncharacterized protein (TIGR03437 family)
VKFILTALALAACLCAQDSTAPSYTAAGLVNGASFANGLAPNTIVSLFGTNLSWDTVTVSSQDMSGSVMPMTLGNVQVFFDLWPAYLYYVSPTQINLLIPSNLLPGTFSFWVDRQGTSGPVVSVTLTGATPAMFMYPAGTAIATHLDGSLCTANAPATAGEIVTLWATGLGQTDPALQDGVLPLTAQPLNDMSQFEVLINGTAVDPSAILYAGVAPGYAGLYQVNVQLPDPLPANPQIQLGLGGALSPAQITIPAE